jgi:hypothetical protein
MREMRVVIIINETKTWRIMSIISSPFRALLPFAALLSASLGVTVAQPPTKPDAAIPPGATFTFGGSRSDFGTITMYDNSTIGFVPTLDNVLITCDRLVVIGKAKIDLTRNVSPPGSASGKPGTPGQALNVNPTSRGQDGTPGQSGSKGYNGINLVLRCAKADVSQGSLWIDTDGGQGGPGAPGGDGAKGSAGPNTCAHNYAGGNGGNGGAGGDGGPGGDTGAIWLQANGKVYTPLATSGTAPTPRPAEANLSGVIVIAGNPGGGGVGGPGGDGGSGGEGHDRIGTFCPDTSAPGGAHGARGPNGHQGPPGKLTTTNPPNLKDL